MSPAVEQLLQAALALSEADRADLLDALTATMEPETGAVLDNAWKAEVARRSAEFDAGLVKPIPWSEVKEAARQKKPSNG
jgi:putative addiction module component (TIGR02574 family)